MTDKELSPYRRLACAVLDQAIRDADLTPPGWLKPSRLPDESYSAFRKRVATSKREHAYDVRCWQIRHDEIVGFLTGADSQGWCQVAGIEWTRMVAKMATRYFAPTVA